MGHLVLDPIAVKQFEEARESTEIRDGRGRIVGVSQPVEQISTQSRAELEARRQNRSARRLSEILIELRQK